MARQEMIASGMEPVELHHQRKEQRGNAAGKPKKLADVYGSRWITAGAGSVVLLWGEPGDPIVEFVHLKQPAGEVGPFKVMHDQHSGSITLHDRVNLLELVRMSPRGLTAQEAARQLYETSVPSAAEVEKARRALKDLVRRDLAHERPAERGGEGGSTPSRWLALEHARADHATPWTARS